MSETPDYVTPDGEELYFWELENRTEALLDELYPLVQIGDMGYEAGRVLREIDPIAFRESVWSHIHSMSQDEELDEWREDHPWLDQEDEEEDEEEELPVAASNAPEGALDVWLRIPEGEEESKAEANTYLSGGRFRVEWYLTAVGLVTAEHFDTYPEARAWLEAGGFEDYSA